MIHTKNISIAIPVFALTTLISINVFSISVSQSDCPPSDPDCHQFIGELEDACKGFSNPHQCKNIAFELHLTPEQVPVCKGVFNQEAEKACLEKIKYFTAIVKPPKWDPSKGERQRAYLRALQSIPNLEVIKGYFKKRQIKGQLSEITRKSLNIPLIPVVHSMDFF